MYSIKNMLMCFSSSRNLEEYKGNSSEPWNLEEMEDTLKFA